jgi:hypothetical protein
LRASSTIRIVVAALAAFVLSATYYGVVVGSVWHELSGTSTNAFAPWQPLAQILRNLVVAYALDYILLRTSAVGVLASLQISFRLWLGFQAMAIIGSVIHEGYPVILYCIHAFDALMTVAVMTICLRAKGDVAPHRLS